MMIFGTIGILMTLLLFFMIYLTIQSMEFHLSLIMTFLGSLLMIWLGFYSPKAQEKLQEDSLNFLLKYPDKIKVVSIQKDKMQIKDLQYTLDLPIYTFQQTFIHFKDDQDRLGQIYFKIKNEQNIKDFLKSYLINAEFTKSPIIKYNNKLITMQ